jgi:hypothetical protein
MRTPEPCVSPVHPMDGDETDHEYQQGWSISINPLNCYQSYSSRSDLGYLGSEQGTASFSIIPSTRCSRRLNRTLRSSWASQWFLQQSFATAIFSCRNRSPRTVHARRYPASVSSDKNGPSPPPTWYAIQSRNRYSHN